MHYFSQNKQIFLTEVDSTNAEAWRLLEKGTIGEGWTLWAGIQTAGRGQRGTAWHAAPGQDLTASVVIRPTHLGAGHYFLLSMVVALSALEAAQLFLPARAGTIQLKWPNDLVLGYRKLGGILIENHWQGRLWQWAIGGLGLNLGQTAFPEGLTATSLRLAGADTVPYRLLLAWLDALNVWYAYSLPGLQDELVSAYHNHLLGMDSWQLYRKPGENPFCGKVEGVSLDGQLRLRRRSGRSLRFGFKEIQWLGPA